jgi:S-adenosylmethionine decarboxylase
MERIYFFIYLNLTFCFFSVEPQGYNSRERKTSMAVGKGEKQKPAIPALADEMRRLGPGEKGAAEAAWRNLAPGLVRQRLMIEGTTARIVEPEQMKKYLLKLAEVTKMEVLSGPYAYTAHDMGYGGWIHWKSSGAHIYSYPTDPPLVTVDIYTCKPFSAREAAEFTRRFFSAMEIVWREIEV